MEFLRSLHVPGGLFSSFPLSLLDEVRPNGPDEHILSRFQYGWRFSVPVAFISGRFG